MHFGGLAEEVRGEAAEVRVSVVETTGTRHAHDCGSRCADRTFSAYFGLWCLCWKLKNKYVLESNPNDANEATDKLFMRRHLFGWPLELNVASCISCLSPPALGYSLIGGGLVFHDDIFNLFMPPKSCSGVCTVSLF